MRYKSRDSVLGRVADILRRSEVEDAEELITLLERNTFNHFAQPTRDTPCSTQAEIRASIEKFGMINVIKAVRERYNITLLEAKAICDRARQNGDALQI